MGGKYQTIMWNISTSLSAPRGKYNGIHWISASKIFHDKTSVFNRVEVFLSCGKISAAIITTHPRISWENDYTHGKYYYILFENYVLGITFTATTKRYKRERYNEYHRRLQSGEITSWDKDQNWTWKSIWIELVIVILIFVQQFDTTHISLANANIASASIRHLSRIAMLPLKLKLLRPYNLALSILRKTPAFSSAPHNILGKETKRMSCHHCNFCIATQRISRYIFRTRLEVWRRSGGIL